MNRLLSAALALILTTPLIAETVTVSETSQGKTTKQTIQVTRTEEAGMVWETSTDKDSSSRVGRNAAGVMTVVESDSPEGKWMLKAEGDVLKASGTYEGKAVSGSLVLKDRIWSLGFDQPLKWAVAKKLTTPLTFLMVNPVQVDKPQEMILTPDGKDTVGGKPALRFKLGLPGAMAMFWSAVIWADPVTGQQVQYKGNKGPGTPEVVLTFDRQG